MQFDLYFQIGLVLQELHVYYYNAAFNSALCYYNSDVPVLLQSIATGSVSDSVFVSSSAAHNSPTITAAAGYH